jgi:hypothetical protein
MGIFKKLFCKHEYELIAKRPSNYCMDWATFSDSGMYDDYKYFCPKCKKTRIVVMTNEKHPEHNPWEEVKK